MLNLQILFSISKKFAFIKLLHYSIEYISRIIKRYNRNICTNKVQVLAAMQKKHNTMKKIIIVGIALVLYSCIDKQNITTKFESHFKTDKQHFSFLGDSERTVIGKKGTKIIIPQGAIENISKTDTIEVILQEVYNVSDMLLKGLSTSSNGKLLESNGMVNITILKNSQMVGKLSKPLGIFFNQESIGNNFNIFYGNENEAGLNWIEENLNQNYHITYYNVHEGRAASPPWRGEYTVGKDIWDSVKWDKNYTQIDSFIVFIGSQDTIQHRQFEEESESIISTKVDKLFKSVELDWINCDRFIMLNNLTDIGIKNSMNRDSYVFCVFKNYNSILSNESKTVISNVPVGELVSFVAIKFTKNSLLLDVIEDIEVTKEMEVTFDLEEIDADAARERIIKLGIESTAANNG